MSPSKAKVRQLTTPAAPKRVARPRPALALDPGKVHAWRIERQLLGSTRATSPIEVATALVGVQAQVVSSAALAIALRSGSASQSGTVDATTRAMLDRHLVRSWAMRGTLHLFAADDVPTVAAALVDKEPWRRPAWLRWFGVTEPEMEALIDAIGDVLDDGTPRTRAELAEEIGTRLGEKQGKLLLMSWGSALKVASDRHFLVQSAEAASGVRFVRASRWIAGWRTEEPVQALATLVERYLAAYGPATASEVRRWWGVASAGAMRPAFEALGARLTEVDVDGVRAFVRSVDIDAIEATPHAGPHVRLVGGFDPMIVGAGLREQLLPRAHLKRVSRTAGWISPVVLVGGRAAGVWDSKRTGDRLAITVDGFEPFSASVRRGIGTAAADVAAAQGATATLAYGRVFTEKGPPLLIPSPADA
jgi:hypothetical protein